MSRTLKKPKILAVVGPTASGKTALGIALAKRFGGEIISADSRQIYRGMDIGTAKAPTSYSSADFEGPAYSEGIPHYLVDIRNPDEDYSVAEFKRDAYAAIGQILEHGALPIIVGGTGLYVKSVVENLDIPEIKADPKLRARIEKEIAARGLETVFKKLVELDPEAAYVVDPKNPRRVVRALEVATITGKPFTAQRRKNEPLYDVLAIGINPPQDVLRERIDRRVDAMIRDGLVDEVKMLMKKYGGARAGAGKKRPVAFDAIGYREIIDALENRCSMDAAITAMKFNTWHFAKRQMTWFKKDKKVKWIKDELAAVVLVKKFLTKNL
jgi:tRNA dimethylallyltransferase